MPAMLLWIQGTFNGDDAMALSYNGTNIDVIGQIGVDPGSSWGGLAVNTTLLENLMYKPVILMEAMYLMHRLSGMSFQSTMNRTWGVIRAIAPRRPYLRYHFLMLQV